MSKGRATPAAPERDQRSRARDDVSAPLAPDAPSTPHVLRLIRANQLQFITQAIAFALCGAYAVTLVTSRGSTGVSTANEWLRHLATWAPVVPLLVRVRRQSANRGAWLSMACGVFAFNLASEVRRVDFPFLVHLVTPTLREALYALSYLTIAVAVAIIMQQSFGPRANSVRLDGIIAGLALASLASMYGFRQNIEISGRSLLAEFNLFNPILVLVLLVLLGAGLVPKHFHTDLTTSLLLVGLAIIAAGDIVALNPQSFSVWTSGALVNFTPPFGLSILALAAWPPIDRPSRPFEQFVAARGLNMIPVIFGALSVAILAISIARPSSESTRLMALGALTLVISRMVLTQSEVRQLGRSNFLEARTDHVTGLANRRAFLEDGEARLAALEDDEQLGIVLIDLDGFKEVNDSIGHAYGDELLRVIGQRFANTIATRGTLARLGGDEFAYTFVVEASTDPITSVNELAKTLANPVSLDGTKVRVSASIGVALWPQHGSTHAELLRSADVAMYEAKHRRGGVCVYRDEIDLNSRERLALINELRTAIERRRLTLHFQPTHDLRTNAVHGVEALVRWQHPTLGLLQPDYFVPLAERVGLIVPLTRTVLDLAITELARLDRNGHHLQMNVNISQWDLMDEHLPESIGRILQWYDMSPERITLEVTESSLGHDPVRAKRSLNMLRSTGVKISIDDFGVGYSSMSQLLDLPVDELKIDKSFVMALESDARAISLIRSIIEMARALKLTVTAEGIENARNFESLRGAGADIIQGEYFSYPLTREELDEFLARTPDEHLVETSEASEAPARRRRHLRVV
ncbi:MAG TPA: EAL domain-containing protein [Acidimicrobiales bacterium]|nr:EAL domain-containing protein [Acidimicrobiales bacterium]